MADSSADTDSEIRAFLSRFTLVPIDADIAEQAVVLRREYRLRLPNDIIRASALALGALLVSRNSKDFPAGNPVCVCLIRYKDR